MKTAKVGRRHPLLFYRRWVDRFWQATLLFAFGLGIAWGWGAWKGSAVAPGIDNIWFLLGAGVFLAATVLIYLARYFAYIQAFRDHLRVVTPIFRMNISYRRFRSVHPANFQQIFPPAESSGADRSFLEPFYGSTVVVVELENYPMDPAVMRLFLPRQMFTRRTPGLVLLVPDWMALSTELDSFQGSWRQKKSDHSGSIHLWRS